MAKATKHRAATTHSGRARNDESTRPKQKSDKERGMASKAPGGTGKRSPTPSADVNAPDLTESAGEPGHYEQRKEAS